MGLLTVMLLYLTGAPRTKIGARGCGVGMHTHMHTVVAGCDRACRRMREHACTCKLPPALASQRATLQDTALPSMHRP